MRDEAGVRAGRQRHRRVDDRGAGRRVTGLEDLDRVVAGRAGSAVPRPCPAGSSAAAWSPFTYTSTGTPGIPCTTYTVPSVAAAPAALGTASAARIPRPKHTAIIFRTIGRSLSRSVGVSTSSSRRPSPGSHRRRQSEIFFGLEATERAPRLRREGWHASGRSDVTEHSRRSARDWPTIPRRSGSATSSSDRWCSRTSSASSPATKPRTCASRSSSRCGAAASGSTATDASSRGCWRSRSDARSTTSGAARAPGDPVEELPLRARRVRALHRRARRSQRAPRRARDAAGRTTRDTGARLLPRHDPTADRRRSSASRSGP